MDTEMVEPVNMIIMGAAGRDFHDFNVYWKNRNDRNVVCFTASQIPDIAGRTYPASLAGPKYPRGIPIYLEDNLTSLIQKHNVKLCALAYSDLPYTKVMSLAAIVNASGANFVILSPDQTQIPSTKPVISVCAVRTGCGKSQTTRYICKLLHKMGKKLVVVRHPMPYGDLEKQRVQRYATLDDMKKHECTIEEMEEYELHIEEGNLLYAGVDYEAILREAEKEADVIVWDGGNNDCSFFKPTLNIVLADPLRPGDELLYYPSETNVRMADLFIVNKICSADLETIIKVENSLRSVNQIAPILRCRSPCTAEAQHGVDAKALITDKKVLVVEDGPTLTHGGMKFGAATVLAMDWQAKTLCDPRPFAKGSLIETFEKYSHLKTVLPAMGYGPQQIKDLQETINSAECDVVLSGTPINLGKLIKINKPLVRVRYQLEPVNPCLLEQAISRVF